jgi:hypothetical protein
MVTLETRVILAVHHMPTVPARDQVFHIADDVDTSITTAQHLRPANTAVWLTGMDARNRGVRLFYGHRWPPPYVRAPSRGPMHPVHSGQGARV